MRSELNRGFSGLAGVAFVVLCAAASCAQQLTEGIPFFEQKVRPLLVEHCYGCHSASSKSVMGAFRLDTKGGLLKGGSHGPAIVPGQPVKSLLIKALQYTDTLKMPPAGKLPDAKIAILAEWIKIGAPDPRTEAVGAKKPMGMSLEDGRKYWAYQPLKRIEIPSSQPLPLNAQPSTRWARTPIDHFILAKLIEKGISPNSAADRRTLIRRAYFDLIGLPPTPDEVNAFLNDRSPVAWEKVIDLLLASSHYGERWGRHWLDLARFAESHGYEQDYDRPNAYHYRDFVIKALNQNMPYDQFCRWQIAGDEFEPENPLALMATGFLAAGTHATQITKNQVEKERYDELDDMLSTTTTSMLALTTGCARCHDHKYDPIPNRDYYRMLSTFTTTVRSDYDVNMDPGGYRTASEAFEKVHDPFVEARSRFETAELPQRVKAWLDGLRSKPLERAWMIPEWIGANSTAGTTFAPLGDGSFLAAGKNADNDVYTVTATTHLREITSVRLEALADPSLPKGGPGRAPNGNFALTDFRLTAAMNSVGAKHIELKLINPRVDFEQKGQLIKDSNGSDKKLGWAVDPQFGKDHTAVFDLATPVGFEDGTTLIFTLKFDHPNPMHSIGRFRISLSTAGNPLTIGGPARPEQIDRIVSSLGGGCAPIGEKDQQIIAGWFRTTDPDWQKLNISEREHAAKAPKPQIQKALISSEGVTAVRTHTQGGDFLDHTWFLTRGDPNKKGEVATQSFLQVLVHTPDGERHWQSVPPKGWRTSYRRRSLANWITDVDAGAGALLARVIVNRLWQHHFGRGIVSTPSDFGVQGERPTHPELLDWLAGELIRNGWKLKPMHKLMMLSAAYMEGANPNPNPNPTPTPNPNPNPNPNQKPTKTGLRVGVRLGLRPLEIDPQNKLYWRHNKQRLEAEVIRDSMLKISGRLDETMYGPGTLDESMKRRSIYFFVKRSKLIPTLMLFDAPNSLLGLGARATTTVAPQALMIMNNPNVRDYANAFAKRIQSGSQLALPEIVVSAYENALSRPPTSAERSQAMSFLSNQTASYQAEGRKDAQEAALEDFCQVLFGLNEFVYID